MTFVLIQYKQDCKKIKGYPSSHICHADNQSNEYISWKQQFSIYGSNHKVHKVQKQTNEQQQQKIT